VFVVPHEACGVEVQRPRGSGMPFVAGAQVPFVPKVKAAEQA
jgi:hypothetical protein